MSLRPVIFISAVSRELRSARQLIANSLHFLGYDAEWQDIFGAGEGDLRAMLRRRIDASAGVIQIIGQCYGAEPTVPDEEFGRVSYTQYETLYAKKCGKKVWLLVLDNTFATDPHDPESEEFRALQQAYRARVRAEAHLYQPIDDPKALEIHIHKLRDDLSSLRRRTKVWLTGLLAALMLIAGGVTWLIRTQHRSEEKIDLVLQNHGKMEQALAQLAETEMLGKQPGEQLSPVELRARAYAVLEKDLALPAGALAKELPGFALQLYSRPDTTLQQRAQAAYALGKFEEAETLSLRSAQQQSAAFEAAQKKAEASRGAAIDDYILASNAAAARIQYADALSHARAAAKLTDRARDPKQWNRAHYTLARGLHLQGQSAEAAKILRDIVTYRIQTYGPEHRYTIISRNSLTFALLESGDHAAAEKEARSLLDIRLRLFGTEHPETLKSRMHVADCLFSAGRFAEAKEAYLALIPIAARILGPEHPSTLASRTNLASTLFGLADHTGAESEFRALLPIRVKVSGPENPETLIIRHNLAGVLTSLGREGRAEEEYRAVLALRQRILGPTHPDTLATLFRLTIALALQGKHADTQRECRAFITLAEPVFGPGHADLLTTRANLARALIQQRDYPGAEQEYRALVTLQARHLGPEHTETLANRGNLANAMRSQGKLLEAEQEYRAVLAIRERVLGPEHPDVFRSLYNVAFVLQAQKKPREALEFAKRADEGRRRVLAANDPAIKDAKRLREQIELDLLSEGMERK